MNKAIAITPSTWAFESDVHILLVYLLQELLQALDTLDLLVSLSLYLGFDPVIDTFYMTTMPADIALKCQASDSQIANLTLQHHFAFIILKRV